MIEKWPLLDSEPIYDFRIFHARRDTRRSPRTGQVHDFFVLDSPDWINIVPLTPAEEVVMVEQYRHGIDDLALEVPGGMVDPDDAGPLETARRELLEETGFAGESVHPIGQVLPNPAFLNNVCYSFLAVNARQIQAPQLEGAEDIAVHLIPLVAIPDMIATGRIRHSLTINAFYFLSTFRARHPALFANHE